MVATLALWLSACAVLTEVAEPVPSAPATSEPPGAEPTVPPAPAAPAPAAPTLASLTLSAEGLGPLIVGSAVPASAEIVRWDPAHCVEEGTGIVEGDPYAGAWLPIFPASPTPTLGERPPFTMMTADGFRDSPIREVTVWSAEVATAEGVRAGDGRAALFAAYPRFDEVVKGELSDVYAIDGIHGRLLFEVAKPSDLPELADYWGTAVHTVLWIRVVSAGGAAAPIAASDAGGPCAL
jgi:hypothetical protein